MEEDAPKPKTQLSANRPPPRPPKNIAIALGPDGDDEHGKFDADDRTTITKKAQGEGKFIRQSGSRSHHGHIVITVEPNKRGKGNLIENHLPAETVPDEYVNAATKAIRMALDLGVAKYPPAADVNVHIIDGSYDKNDSSVGGFMVAGFFAILKAIKEAGPVVIKIK